MFCRPPRAPFSLCLFPGAHAISLWHLAAPYSLITHFITTSIPYPPTGEKRRRNKLRQINVISDAFSFVFPDNGISVFGGGASSSLGRPTFAGRIQNVTVNVGKEAVLACPVNNIGKYKVRRHQREDRPEIRPYSRPPHFRLGG